MFERFTEEARRAVGQAGRESAELGHGHVGTEHLLLAVLAETADPAARVLIEAGLDHAEARRAVGRLLGTGGDAQALASIGVDLEAVREAVESVFGAGALDSSPPAEPRRRGWFRAEGRSPFTAPARKAVELSLRESLRMKSGHIAVGHLLLGVLREGEGLGARVVADHGLDLAEVRREVEVAMG
ncbi:Clp protease N-terminal domain-containing protein [Kitasatospora purpeofusca]|uniref:Clp protease N-terminal domain-containing protein n=1 Tax=Kitasatospora purpeofusca TaxID=67352 RepID=UPI0035D53081